MPTCLRHDEHHVQGERGDRGKGQLRRSELRTGATEREGRQYQAQGGQCGHRGQRRAGSLCVEHREVEPHSTDEQSDTDDAVAADHHCREHRVAGQRCSSRAARDHQRHDQAHLDDRHSDRQYQRPEWLTDAVGNDLSVIDSGQDYGRECECNENLDDDADTAPPGERENHRRQHGDNHRPRQDLGS